VGYCRCWKPQCIANYEGPKPKQLLPLTYRKCQTPEDFARFEREVLALEKAYEDSAKFDAERYAEWAKTHTFGPEDEAALEEAEYYKELDRGYARDRR
jgi:hypothetical protein